MSSAFQPVIQAAFYYTKLCNNAVHSGEWMHRKPNSTSKYKWLHEHTSCKCQRWINYMYMEFQGITLHTVPKAGEFH